MTYLQLDDTSLTRADALWTAREIEQQPESWRRTRELVHSNIAAIDTFLAPLLAKPDLRIILTGAGSSSFIGECLAPLMLRALKRRVEAIASTDLLSGPRDFMQRDAPTLLVSFARSGGSPESIAVVELADQLLADCHQLLFTCNEQGTLYERCRHRAGCMTILLPPETHDRSFAMTSSFTSMMLAAWLVFCVPDRGLEAVPRIVRATRSLLRRHNESLRKLASTAFSRVVYLGSNAFKALAREASLKLLELTDGEIISTFDSPLSFRHGPKTIVTPDTLIFVFLSNDAYTRRYDLDLLQELRNDGIAGRVVAVTAQTSDAAREGHYLEVEDMSGASDGELLFPYIVCGQLYAFHRALSLGNAPDQPSRSGTVSRVVDGVTVHPL